VGLTHWKPAVSVTVNGANITPILLPRLVSLSITDAVGTDSDTMQMTLADHIGMLPIAIPPAGAEIEVALGYLFAAKKVGIYIVDEVQVSGPPGQMTITAYAATHGDSDQGKKPLSEQRNRSWPDGTTVAAMVQKIAGEAGFEAKVSEAAAAIVLPHLDQITESDLSVLTRVAKDYGLIFKPGGGKIVVAKVGELPTPTVLLTPKQVTQWQVSFARREAAGKVVATYRDTGASDTIDVEVEVSGVADPVKGATQTRRIRRIFPTKEAAEAAAKAEADKASRASRQLSLTLPGRTDLIAEGRVVLAGFRPGVNGEWLVKSVQHAVDSGGYRCSVTAEAPPA